MPRNGSGVYEAPSNSWNPATDGNSATSSDWNSTQQDYENALTQSVARDGQSPMTAPLPMGNNKITGLAAGTVTTDAVQLGQLYSFVGQSGSGASRQRIDNGNFQVNQRAVSGTVTLAAGAYGHDRWKAGSSGCTYTFSASGSDVTLTITAGSLQQVVEGLNVEGGTYALSWIGTSQGRIGGGSYSATGVTGSATSGANLTIEFNAGTLGLVQLEPGTSVTPFQRRPIALEWQACQRYYEVGKLFVGGAYPTGGAGAQGYGETIFKAVKRVTPTMAQLVTSTSFNVSTNSFQTVDTTGAAVVCVQGPSVGNFSLSLYWSASADL